MYRINESELKNPFPSYYEEFIFVSRYSKWLESEKRRETWFETVSRLMNFYQERAKFTEEEYKEVFTSIFNLETMPSMRALMSAGPAAARDHVATYNCSYLPVDSVRAFDEAMYILMCGTGVGYSVERKYVDRLPTVAESFHDTDTVIVAHDSKIGWAKAYRQLLALLYAGEIPSWDFSKIRPAGARLKTFGGRASGPEPLHDLFHFTVSMFRKAAGRQLTTLEAHDLMCKIADIVVVGGVRRSAMISLSDVTDDRMRTAKSGEWYVANGQRRLANNSAVYERRRPEMETFIKEWKSLYESKSGERGMFSRYACENIVARNGRRDPNHEWGTNPCSEIILRPYEFCNLTEVVVRAEDTIEDLKRKARVAAILGTIQSSFTDFRYLRKIWKDNCDEERLLGVSLTGICDNRFLVGAEALLAEVRDHVNEINRTWAERLGIAVSAATTCVKPSGTVSQLVNASSGMHTRFAPYYLRAVRADNKDPLTQFMIASGVPYEADVMNKSNTVFYFPIKSPFGSVTRNDLTAIDTLEMWKDLQEHWCEHKPSVTINVKEEEWMEVGAWCYKNFDMISGVSFLPFDGGSYRQAPYQELTEEQYNEWVAKMPEEIDWKALQHFEKEDTTTGNQELACSAGVCEVVSIGNVES
jgi:ribonucleoside-diphosphate reductase alpha chain